MTERENQAEKLNKALNLSIPPIAVAMSDSLPAGIAMFNGRVAAGCSFWEFAASSTFATSAQDHQSCSIGIHTHNLANAPEAQASELQITLKAMMGLDYVTAEEVAAIPVIKQQQKYAIYGPLAEIKLQPDVVLLFAHAQQGLVLTEAVERVDQSIPLAMGRPACAVIPQAINKGRAAMSLGCCGARAYLDAMTEVVALWALPASKLNEYTDQVEIFAQANSALTQFHQARKSEIAAGKNPTVEDTLKIFG